MTDFATRCEEAARDAQRWKFAVDHPYCFMQALQASERGESLIEYIDKAIDSSTREKGEKKAGTSPAKTGAEESTPGSP